MENFIFCAVLIKEKYEIGKLKIQPFKVKTSISTISSIMPTPSRKLVSIEIKRDIGTIFVKSKANQQILGLLCNL